MKEKRYGNQNPTEFVVQPYEKSRGQQSIDLYESSGRTLYPWQKQAITDMLAIYEEVTGEFLFVHDEIGYSVGRRNGKTEIMLCRILDGYLNGENGLYTAHLVDSSTDMAEKTARLFQDLGFTEILRISEETEYKDAYMFKKQRGAQRIIFYNDDGTERCYVDFRTRSGQGGLGKGYDYVIIDEAQEYTTEQQTASKYVVSAAKNPQRIMCGTPPTKVSKGTVFEKYRKDVLSGIKNESSMWFAWAVDKKPKDITDRELWYLTNPSLGYHLTERKIKAELGDDDDFLIQRLGYWSTYNLTSAISEEEWKTLSLDKEVSPSSKLFIGIKYSLDNTVALSICVKTEDKPLIESIDCRSVSDTNKWIIEFCKKANRAKIVIDGESGRKTLEEELIKEKVRDILLVSVEEFKKANEVFRKGIIDESFYHNNQPSLNNIATNVDKRPIGNKGGFGYKSIKSDADIALLDSAILAYWASTEFKEKKRTRQVRF